VRGGVDPLWRRAGALAMQPAPPTALRKV
jgi:hypothetical protein